MRKMGKRFEQSLHKRIYQNINNQKSVTKSASLKMRKLQLKTVISMAGPLTENSVY